MKKLFQLTVISLLLGLNVVGCATNKKTRWALMAAAAPVGAGIGYSAAPEGEKPEAHAGTWAAVFALGAAIIGNIFYTDEGELEKEREKNKKLNAEIIELKNPPTFLVSPGTNEGKLIFPTNSKKKDDGTYRYRKANDWLNLGNKRYHYDMVIEKVEKGKDEKN